jgi:hypothetical protein
MAMPAIHNPMHSCYKAYRRIEFNGMVLLIKAVSAGVIYAIQNDEWIKEMGMEMEITAS